MKPLLLNVGVKIVRVGRPRHRGWSLSIGTKSSGKICLCRVMPVVKDA